MANLILASSSPRRQQLLQQLGLVFSCYSPEIDESVLPHENASQYVLRLAQLKAQTVSQNFPADTIIAADTCIALDGQIITKPQNKQHAFQIWSALSGRQHQVLTAICVRKQQKVLSQVVQTQVEFQRLSVQDMEYYWATGEAQDKAGAYAIQGIAAQYIVAITGSYSNVVGLPLHETMQLLKALDT
ncbi:Maf family nucleotide pyrophosphatase [Acinetobacter larvae]|uniref:dTTP/UTP pyrophosphatase n=1 Tax=Acinetobacter larvae TaxID=1789224 RepID=A0A1B2LXE3_9GAMM|nr:Maf family nucleotide pyrophosphatase [Acinetobacter larvae]AOA57600.1 septum formation protein Maf [Acinetobacter larvae]